MSAFLDTNVVVRYLTGSPADAAERASKIIGSSEDLYLTDAVVAEIGYVLDSVYGLPRHEIVDSLVELVSQENIITYRLDKGLVVSALLLCRLSGRVSFTDALTWAAARSSSVNAVYSFDERFPSDSIDLRREARLD